MIGFTNGDLYSMLLDRIRKDQKGLIAPEEFEAFLRWRSLDKFSKLLSMEGVDKRNHEALSPFYIHHEGLAIQTLKSTYYVNLKTIPSNTTTTSTTTLEAATYLDYALALLVNTWTSDSIINYSSLVHIDLISSAEFSDRLGNSLTQPTAVYPVAYRDDDKLWVFGPTDGYVILDYYRYPTPEYFDYYVDANGNITYLTDGQASYTLQAGEVARDGTTAGGSVTSASVDSEWGDDDALEILDMIVSDVSIALSDPDSFQASLIERKENE